MILSPIKMLALLLIAALAAGSAHAQPTCPPTLTASSGPNLPLPPPASRGIPPNATAPTLTFPAVNTFQGTFGGTAASPWRGTFTATGPVPSSVNAGTTKYNFSGLAAGALPPGTFFNFGDVDGGSGSGEIITLRALGPSGAPITGAWLSNPANVWGTGRDAGGAINVLDLPGWSFNAVTGTYVINGTTVRLFNPTVSFVLTTVQKISGLEVSKPATNNGFGITAPTVDAADPCRFLTPVPPPSITDCFASLTANGNNLPLPPTDRLVAPNASAPAITTVPGGFTGNFSAPAASAWRGIFTATGPIPGSGLKGTVNYDFTPLTGGTLPAGSYFSFGDLDGGSSTDEVITVKAWGVDNNVIVTPWLSNTTNAWGSGRAANGGPDAVDLPTWAFDASTGIYTFDGTGILNGFNPTVAVSLLSLVPITKLEVVKRSEFNGFGISAPVEGAFPCGNACPAGYTLASGVCEDINECATNNGGCDINAGCSNTAGSFSCACNSGFAGDGKTCTEINECATNNGGCSSDAVCNNTIGSFKCTCKPGFTGDGFNCTDFNECLRVSDNRCSRDAICTNLPGNFSCACKPGYSGDGKTCTDINECTVNANICGPASVATCQNTVGSYNCICKPGYVKVGADCVDINECTASPPRCPANSICTNLPGSYNCSCLPGYGGPSCARCNPSTYSPGGSLAACLSCPARQKPNAGLTGCECVAGANPATSCNTCLPSFGGPTCSPCTPNTYSAGGSLTPCGSCLARQKVNAARTGCECVAGANPVTYCNTCLPAFGGPTCSPCGPNTYSAGGSLAPCGSCPARQKVNSARTGCECERGAGPAGVCNTCLPAYGGPNCSPCSANTYAAGGSLAACTTCPTRQKVNSAQTGCECTTGANPATSCNTCLPSFGGPTCSPCTPNTYSAGGSLTPCGSCPARQKVNSARTGCECTIGANPATNCNTCLPTFGGPTCSTCGPNTYSAGGSLNPCASCPTRQKVNGARTGCECVAGANPATSCGTCLPGFGGANCSPCTGNTYSPGGSLAPCSACFLPKKVDDIHTKCL